MTVSILPDFVLQQYPKVITAKTKLTSGISIAKFLGGCGNRVTLNEHSEKQKQQILRNLTLQAQAVELVVENSDFADQRLVVDEGIFVRGENETITEGSCLDLAQTGRCIVYSVNDLSGKQNIRRTFDVAVYWKSVLRYNKITLDYDSYDVSEQLNAQIILEMPEVSEDWTVENYSFTLETIYNNIKQSSELVEVLE